MFDHILDYFNNHTFTEALSIGVVPSVLFVAVLILVLKIIEMNKYNQSKVFKTAARISNREAQAIHNAELQKKLNDDHQQGQRNLEIDRLYERVATLKAANEELREKAEKQ